MAEGKPIANQWRMCASTSASCKSIAMTVRERLYDSRRWQSPKAWSLWPDQVACGERFTSGAVLDDFTN
jgi:hypothetical protein